LDALLSGAPATPLAVTAVAIAKPGEVPVAAAHPLDGVSDVKKAAVIIGRMLAEDAVAKQKRVYNRCVLRQQHLAAFMLVNPFASTTDICAFFHIGPASVYNIVRSDTFKALVNHHRLSLENSIGVDLQEQLRLTLSASLDVVQRAVIEKQDPDFALAVMDRTANRLGMGAKHNTNVQINNNIVTADMIAAARAARQPRVIEATPQGKISDVS
jgi:hypothetical protein